MAQAGMAHSRLACVAKPAYACEHMLGCLLVVERQQLLSGAVLRFVVEADVDCVTVCKLLEPTHLAAPTFTSACGTAAWVSDTCMPWLR